MTQYGRRTSFYIQKELLQTINDLSKIDVYKSRSHFINCALIREIRRNKTK